MSAERSFGEGQLMRGHGFAAAARSLIEVVRMSVYTPRNARALLTALALGEVTPLSLGEIKARNAGYKPYSPETQRAWEYWARRAGCGDMLG
jgi:ribulose-5-phosphate 4-epimerase/fuculose-1-phosphate aldolase